MYRKTRYIQGSLLSIISGNYLESWNKYHTGKGGLLDCFEGKKIDEMWTLEKVKSLTAK